MREATLLGSYTIKENGQITSRFGRVLRTHLSRAGYLVVELWENNKGRKYLLHRLLAESFIPNPSGKPQINHIDGDKLNNSLDNLEWVTQSENQLHAYRIGLQRGYKKPTPLSEAHKSSLCGSRWNHEQHVWITGDIQFTKLTDAASHWGVSRQTILNRCRSASWPTWSKKVERREQCPKQIA